ncbi:molecular chaperone DnaJ [bacterium]|nr:molecular chaperone DnaJ [bacterium]
MSQKDFYEILGVARDSDDETIKKAYRKLAMKYHPDRNEGNTEAEATFKQIGEAYAVLSDPQKRARYDRFGEAGIRGGAGGFGGGVEVDPFEIFREFMGGFGFGDIFGESSRSSQRGPRMVRGRDLQINMKLTLEEIAEGVSKKLRVSRFVACEDCMGSGARAGSKPTTCSMCKGAGQVRQISRSFLGQVQTITTCPQCNGAGEQISDPCPTCSGEGRTRSDEPVEVHIPAGVANGNVLTLRNEGHAGPHRGPSGDLLVAIKEEEHPLFEREGDDIIYHQRISIPDAILGTEIEVPTLYGDVEIDIPAGIQSGKVLRLRGKGLKRLRGSSRGDQLVVVEVYIPKKISSQERKALQSFSSSESFVPPQKEGKNIFSRAKDAFFGNAE